MGRVNPNHFDRSKPFYPLVINYVCQLAGIKELALRWFAGDRDLDELMAKASALGRVTLNSDAELSALREKMRMLAGPLDLAAQGQSDALHIDLDELSRELAEHALYLLPLYLNSAGSILVLAH
jgi:hypothetical protein